MANFPIDTSLKKKTHSAMIKDFHEDDDDDDDQRCIPVSFAARMVQNAPISIPWWQCEHNATASITLKTLSITVAINN